MGWHPSEMQAKPRRTTTPVNKVRSALDTLEHAIALKLITKADIAARLGIKQAKPKRRIRRRKKEAESNAST